MENQVVKKSKLVTFLLTYFVGGLGVHRFYLGKIGTGVLWLITGGIFGIGAFVDLIMLAFDNVTDSEGMPLENDIENKWIWLAVFAPLIISAIYVSLLVVTAIIGG